MAGDLEKKITAKYVLDSSGFNSGLQGINSNLKQNKAQLDLATQGMKSFGTTSNGLKGVQAELTKQFDLQKQKVDLYKQSLEKTNTKMQDNISARDKLKTSLDMEKAKLESVAKTYGKNNEVAATLKGKIAELTEEYNKKSKAVENNAKSMNTNNINMAKAQIEMVKTEGTLNKLNKELAENESKWLSAGKSMQGAGEDMKSFGSKVSGVGKGLTAGVTVPLLGIGAVAAKIGMDFESQMSRVKAISGSTADEFKTLEKAALDLGASSAFSAIEVAKAQENLASAGFKSNEILSATPGILDLAASSGEDLATSSTIAAGAIRGFGLEASQSAHVADVLAKASADTNAGVASMGTAFSYVAPLARGVGWDIESVASAVGAMADANIDGSTSGTTLRGVISRLANPSKESAGAMEDLGFKAFDVQGKMKPLSTISDELCKSMVKLTDQQKQEAISTIFGQEAMSGMMVLMQKGKPELDKMAEGFRNSDGAAKDMAETMQDNAKSSVEQMMGSMETAAIKITQAISPTIIKLAEKVQGLADKFSKLTPETQENIIKFGLLAAAAGPVILVAGSLVSTIGTLATGLGAISKTIGLTTTATTALKTTTAITTGGLGTLTTGLGTAAVATEVAGGATVATTGAMAGLGAIALPVTLAIAGIAGAVVLYNSNSDLMKEKSIASAESMGLLETAMAGMHGQVIHSNSDLEKMNVNYKQWNEKVSPETQAALEATAKRIADYSMELKNAEKIDNLADSESGKRLVDGINAICDSAIAKIKSKTPEIQKTLSDGFNADGVLTEDEKKILESLNKSGEDQIAKINEINAKVLELEKRAGTEQGETKKATLDEMARLTIEVGNITLQNTVKSNEELLNATATFNERMSNLDMTSLSGLLAEKATARDAENTKQTEYYNKQIELLKLNFVNVDAETQVAYTAQIAVLEKQKTDSITKENEKYNGYLVSAQEKYPLLQNYINGQNGELLTKAEQQKQFELDKYAGKMDNMLGITKTGYYQIKNNVSGNMHDTYVEVDNATGQINGVWDKTTGQIMGNPIKAREDIDEELKNGQAFQPIANSYDEKKKEIAENKIEVYTEEREGMFDWVTTAYTSAQSWLSEHPFISSIVSGGNGRFKEPEGNWTGTDNFSGGLTYMHERGYELYNLPQQSKIYNHEASEAMIMKSAEAVATKVADGMMKNFNGNSGGYKVTQNIYSPTPSPSEIARQTKNSLRELALNL